MKFLNTHARVLRPLEWATVLICLIGIAFCVNAFLRNQHHNDMMLVSMAIDFFAVVDVLIAVTALTIDKRSTIHNDLQMLIFTLAAIVMMLDSLTAYYDGQADRMAIHYGAYFVLNLLFLSIAPMFVDYMFMNSALQEDKRRPLSVISNIFFVIGLAMLVTNHETGLIFSIDDAGHVIHGTYSFLFFLCPHLLGTIGLLAVYKYIDDRRERTVAVIMLAVMWIIFVLQELAKDISPIYLVPSFVLLISFSNNYIFRSQIIARREAQIVKKDLELEDLRFQSMVSQVQPHFLYNALTSIMNIKDTPDDTKDAIADFARYLRTNLDSINTPHPIPFSKELDHIETYLSLEKLRFKDKLQVDWHINDKRFAVPALAVQTLVENAVRHGISKRPDGGRITIVSEEVEDGHMVKVIDNGLGFDIENPIANDGKSHAGIYSSGERLKVMCNGTLKVKSVPGRGTTVMIFIPESA